MREGGTGGKRKDGIASGAAGSVCVFDVANCDFKAAPIVSGESKGSGIFSRRFGVTRFQQRAYRSDKRHVTSDKQESGRGPGKYQVWGAKSGPKRKGDILLFRG